MSHHGLLRALAFAAALSSLTACASAGGPGHTAAPHRNSSVITAEDMSQLHLSNLYEVVQRLHPEWLAPHNSATLATTSSGNSAAAMIQVQVYLDSQHAGSVDVLRQIPIGGAASVHYYNAAESEIRFGTGYSDGVIQVITVGK